MNTTYLNNSQYGDCEEFLDGLIIITLFKALKRSLFGSRFRSRTPS